MPTYIALLRGINVSGQKIIKMAELRVQLEEIALENVKTYIQSGNIVFDSKEKSGKKLEKKINDMIQKEYGWEVPILVKSAMDLQKAHAENLFLKDKKKDPARIYFTFLSEKPTAANVKIMEGVSYPPEDFVIKGNNVYGYSPNGFGRAKISNNLIERKLKVRATSRNVKTVLKLIEMAFEN